MRENSMCKSREAGFTDPVYRYILAAAGIIFLYISLGRYALALYEHCLIIPCLMLLGVIRERGTGLKYWKRFLLPLAMVGWFLILQIRRSIVYDEGYNVGLFLSTYLFAFPLATILDDGDTGKALKIFAGAYLAVATVLAMLGMLLICECLPVFLTEEVLWNGGRLEINWHSNVVACYFMVGIVFCATYLISAKSLRSKIVLGMLLALLTGMLALTSCRTAIILAGGYLGSTLFFEMIRRGRKWFFPGAVALVLLTVVFYIGSMCLYQANCDMLIKKYAQQYSSQLVSQSADSTMTETNIIIEEALPVAVNSDTGEAFLVSDSAQGSIKNDVGTLNSRTYIWNAALLAIRESRDMLLWGIGNPGWYVSFYNSFPIGHLHNSWLECLVGLGFAGFLMAVLFTLLTVWNCLVIFCRHYSDIWRRNMALLTLCLMGVSFLQSYLFYSPVRHHPIDFLFFLCAGYLVHWQAEDNRRILAAVRSKFPLLKR